MIASASRLRSQQESPVIVVRVRSSRIDAQRALEVLIRELVFLQLGVNQPCDVVSRPVLGISGERLFDLVQRNRHVSDLEVAAGELGMSARTGARRLSLLRWRTALVCTRGRRYGRRGRTAVAADAQPPTAKTALMLPPPVSSGTFRECVARRLRDGHVAAALPARRAARAVLHLAGELPAGGVDVVAARLAHRGDDAGVDAALR